MVMTFKQKIGHHDIQKALNTYIRPTIPTRLVCVDRLT